jgi:hypothetical protein
VHHRPEEQRIAREGSTASPEGHVTRMKERDHDAERSDGDQRARPHGPRTPGYREDERELEPDARGPDERNGRARVDARGAIGQVDERPRDGEGRTRTAQRAAKGAAIAPRTGAVNDPTRRPNASSATSAGMPRARSSANMHHPSDDTISFVIPMRYTSPTIRPYTGSRRDRTSPGPGPVAHHEARRSGARPRRRPPRASSASDSPAMTASSCVARTGAVSTCTKLQYPGGTAARARYATSTTPDSPGESAVTARPRPSRRRIPSASTEMSNEAETGENPSGRRELTTASSGLARRSFGADVRRRERALVAIGDLGHVAAHERAERRRYLDTPLSANDEPP